MKQCPNCKATLEDDEQFCHECGTKQEIEEVRPQDEATPPPFEKKCIHCGEKIEGDSIFCPFCGTSQDVKEANKDENAPTNKETISEENINPKENSGQETPEEQSDTHEWDVKRISLLLVIIVLAAILIGGCVWLYLSRSGSSSDVDNINVEVVDTTNNFALNDDLPKSAYAFLEQFYTGEYEDEDYIRQHVTANALNKLKREYDYDCPSNDCLATWVFTAYPPESDYNLEEGPIISPTNADNVFKVEFKYSSYDEKTFWSTVYFKVVKIDGRYKIADYKVVFDESELKEEENSQSNEYKEERTSNYEESFESQPVSERTERKTKKYEVRPNPVFPGNLQKWLAANIVYPAEAAEHGNQGRVQVQVTIDEDGDITYARIVKSVCPSIDREALSVVKRMPRWTPASDENGPKQSTIIIPISFMLEK